MELFDNLQVTLLQAMPSSDIVYEAHLIILTSEEQKLWRTHNTCVNDRPLR